jgi:hypothetical protein
MTETCICSRLVGEQAAYMFRPASSILESKDINTL